MQSTVRKMQKIIDELVFFFFSVGANGIKIDLERTHEGYRLICDSGYQKSDRARIRDLDKYLKVTERNIGLEEFSWQLAGVNAAGQDSEIHLIGQMVDDVKLDIGEDTVHLELLKKVI